MEQKEIKTMSLEDYIRTSGYTREEWDKCFDELCAKGIAKGCYDDYNLLALVIQWNCTPNCISTIEVK